MKFVLKHESVQNKIFSRKENAWELERNSFINISRTPEKLLLIYNVTNPSIEVMNIKSIFLSIFIFIDVFNKVICSI